MTWLVFPWFAIPTLALWLLGAFLAARGRHTLAAVPSIAAVILLGAFIAGLWHSLGRPPMRTMGETRMLYAFFLAVMGLAASARWRYPWLLAIANLLACVFLTIVLARPDTHTITLMPALQSPWFVPHVTVYILSYAILGVGTLAALRQLWELSRGHDDWRYMPFVDNIVAVGLGFLLLGMLSGAAWAKEAWGHYWSWDPKETWAFVTACGYVAFLHLRLRVRRGRPLLLLLVFAFLMLMVAWLGVSYIPAAKGSVHVYS